MPSSISSSPPVILASKKKRTIIPAQGNGRRAFLLLPEVLSIVERVIRANVERGSQTNGVEVAAFEEAFKAYLGVAEVVAVSSGTAALWSAFELLRLPPGEVIMPALTFISTAYAVSRAFTVDAQGVFDRLGLVPVFVDVDPITYTMDIEQVKQAITPKTRALVAAHLLGQMCEMGTLMALAQERSLFVIEDAAQAIGASYLNPKTLERKKAGSAGHIGCFSLSDVKNAGSMGGDAGALTFSREIIERFPDIVVRARAWRNLGRMAEHRYSSEGSEIGDRARGVEYEFAVARMELSYVNQWNHDRRKRAERYTMALKDSTLLPPVCAPGREHVFFHYMVQAESEEGARELKDDLREAGIAVGDTYTCIPDQRLCRTKLLPSRSIGSLDISRRGTRLLVPLPLYPELHPDEEARILRVLACFRKKECIRLEGPTQVPLLEIG